MRTLVKYVLLLLAVVAMSSSPAQAEQKPTSAHLLAHIRIPQPLLSQIADERDGKRIPYAFGGDIRIGDVNDDGTMDFVLAKAIGGIKTCMIGAFTWNGEVLWQWGDRRRAVVSLDSKSQTYKPESPARPGPLLVIDIDGDKQTEVVAMVLNDDVTRTSKWDMKGASFIILDGKTGKVERQASPEALLKANAFGDDGKRHEPNYVHLRILAADFRGLGAPRDFVIKIGNSVIACDDQLNVLWTYKNKFAQYGQHSSYIPSVGDVDNDGRDEVTGGQYLLDHDGTVMWEKMRAKHNDSVAIVDWDGNLDNGREIVMSGFGQVVNAAGKVLMRLGEAVVPHGQELRCGPFRLDVPGLQMAIRYDGHTNKILMADRAGKVISKFTVDHSHIEVGMETVYWHGFDRPALLYSPTALYDGHGRKVVTLPGIPHASKRGRMGWHHCIPADIDGSGREAIVLHDPYTDEVFVYGAKPLTKGPPVGYRHTVRQYNVRLMD